MADVFISYGRPDLDTARAVHAGLTRSGFTVWTDQSLRAGTYSDQIRHELVKSNCVVVLWSQHARESDWVILEAEHGRRRGILVSVLLDDTAVHDLLSDFERLHALRIRPSRGADVDAQLGPLCEAVTQLLNRFEATECEQAHTQWLIGRSIDFKNVAVQELQHHAIRTPERFDSAVRDQLRTPLGGGECIVALCADKGLEPDPRTKYFQRFMDWARRSREFESGSGRLRSSLFPPIPPNRIRLCRLFVHWDDGAEGWVRQVIDMHREPGSVDDGVVALEIPAEKTGSIAKTYVEIATALDHQFGFVVFLRGRNSTAITHCGGSTRFSARTIQDPLNVSSLVSLFESLRVYSPDEVRQSGRWAEFTDRVRLLLPGLL